MKRRQFLKRTGSAGAAAAIAGCMSGDAEAEEIVISSFPTNMPQLEYMVQEGIVEDEMNEAGYDHEIQWTFEGPSQFAAGQSDIAVNLSTIDAARMADERDMEITIAAKMMTNFNGMFVRSDSDYAPSQVGDRQTAIDNVVEDDATVGIFGWSSGHIPTDQVIFQEVFGYTFASDDDTFEVVETSPSALAEQLMSGELDVSANAPTQGIAENILDGDAEVLWHGSDELAQRDFGMAPLINSVVRPEFVDEHEEAIAAWLRAWERGTDWLFENGIDEIPGDDDLMEQIGTQDPETAEYITEWITDEGDDIPASYETEMPRHHRTAEMDDEWLDQNHQFMDNAAEIGQAPENWDELLTYERIDY